MIKRLFSTSLRSYRIDPASIASNNMMNKMLRRQQKEIEKHKQRIINNQKPKPGKAKPNNLKFEDTDKTRAFNVLFHQNIQLVLHSPSFHQHFANIGLTITKVKR